MSFRALQRRLAALARPRPGVPRGCEARVEASTGLRYYLAHNAHGRYCVPAASAHRPAAAAVLRGRVFEPKTLEFLRRHWGGGDVVHAGTYFGDFLPLLSRVCGDSGLVWAFEPHAENFRCAELTVRLNGLENVRLTPAGLGAAATHRPFRSVDARGRPLGGGSRFLAGPGDHMESDVETEVVRLDDVLPPQRRLSLIQLDVEGWELPALQGGIQSIRRHRPRLVLEELPGCRLESDPWFQENVLRLGYRRVAAFHDNAAYAAAG